VIRAGDDGATGIGGRDAGAAAGTDGSPDPGGRAGSGGSDNVVPFVATVAGPVDALATGAVGGGGGGGGLMLAPGRRPGSITHMHFRRGHPRYFAFLDRLDFVIVKYKP
jgi:hypothetical protein